MNKTIPYLMKKKRKLCNSGTMKLVSYINSIKFPKKLFNRPYPKEILLPDMLSNNLSPIAII